MSDQAALLVRGVGQEDEKLIPTDSADRIVGSKTVGQAVRDLAEDFVAGAIPWTSLISLKSSQSTSSAQGGRPRGTRRSSMTRSMPRRLSASVSGSVSASRSSCWLAITSASRFARSSDSRRWRGNDWTAAPCQQAIEDLEPDRIAQPKARHDHVEALLHEGVVERRGVHDLDRKLRRTGQLLPRLPI
jgi:hypothetical protein